MKISVTIDPSTEDGLTTEQVAELLRPLKPASISVDCAGGLGKVLLASLQSRGMPATALEKRERPVLAEVQRISDLCRAAEDLKQTIKEQRIELEALREYKRDIRILLSRLE